MLPAMYELEKRVLVTLPRVLGVDLSITNEVVLLWAAAVLTLGILLPACRRRQAVARGVFRNLFETLVEFIDREVVRENVGPAGRSWAPFLLTLFFFILFANLMGLIPLPTHVKSMTSDLSVTVALALIVFVLTVSVNIRTRGLIGFLKKFYPAGTPCWIAVPMVPIEIVSWLARPITLAIRLFVNMMVGHHLLFLFIGLEIASAWYLKAVPFVGAVLMSCFELFVCFIQAFVFTMLAGVYIREAIEAH
jgi:F-type H+-transporting ATPase subunit a